MLDFSRTVTELHSAWNSAKDSVLDDDAARLETIEAALVATPARTSVERALKLEIAIELEGCDSSIPMLNSLLRDLRCQ